MKIGIPTFGDRVSPRFDCAQAVLVVTIEAEQVKKREMLGTSSWTSTERIDRLVELDISAVICGGIDRWSAESLDSAGITVYPGLAGKIEDALTAFLRGELTSRCLRPAPSDGQRLSKQR
jgi:predicted Fe-Mo cluster-binding NifX family protein